VTIAGRGFTGAKTVTIGSTSVPFTVVSHGTITVAAPAVDPATLPVAVTTWWGPTRASTAARVTIIGPGRPTAPVRPTITGTSPYKGRQASEVTASVLFVLMLGRAPTTDEFSSIVAALDGGGTTADLAALILTSDEYSTRVGAAA
jgi:hypothetical protein